MIISTMVDIISAHVTIKKKLISRMSTMTFAHLKFSGSLLGLFFLKNCKYYTHYNF